MKMTKRTNRAKQRGAAMVEGIVPVEPVGEIEIKGLSRPVQASNVVRGSSDPTVLPAPAGEPSSI